MPAIKVYKANGKMVPVDEAKIAKAYQCPWTDKVFATKSAYSKHLKELRENRMHQRARQNIRNRKLNDLINQSTFQDIVDWIETNPEFIFDGLIKLGHSGWANRRAHLRNEFWIKITHLNLNWSDMVSNSHSCPRGGVTCWSSQEATDGRPRGYPGWHGRIEFQLSHNFGFGSDVFRNMGIHTGTGGGSSDNRFGYDVKFFSSDWPGLRSVAIGNKLANIMQPQIKIGSPIYFR
jgi:hypothetical protein